MTRDRRRAQEGLEAVGADAATTATEGAPSEDTWFGRGAHGWFDRLGRALRAR